MPPVAVYRKKGGKRIEHSTKPIAHYFGVQRSTEQTSTEQTSDEPASSSHLHVPQASNGPQSKKRRISDDQNPQTSSPGVMGNTEVVNRSGANPQPIDTNTGDVSLSDKTSGSNSHAVVDDDNTTGRCSTPDGGADVDAEDASTGEDIFDSFHHCSPEDEHLDSNAQALEEDDEFLNSVVFDDTDDKDDEDALVSQHGNGKSRVETAMRLTIKMLKEAADNMNLDDPSDRTPMTRAIAVLLRKNDVDHFLGHYLCGFPPKVLALFEQATWSLDDLLNLSLGEIEGRTGIYLIVARRTIGALGGYIGSTGCAWGIAGRYKRHKTNAKSDRLPDSLLYSFVRRDEVKWSPRVITRFAPPLPDTRYLLLLEGIMACWFSTLYPPKSDQQFFSLAGWKLSQQIRDAIDIPSVPQWEALNKAFQLNQGAPRPRSLAGTRVCVNPNCGQAGKDAGYFGYFGRAKDTWHEAIRGQFICKACWTHASRHEGELRPFRPPKPVVPMGNRVCAGCQSTSPKGEWWSIGHDDWNEGIRNQYICRSCYGRAWQNQRDEQGVVPTQRRFSDAVCANTNCGVLQKETQSNFGTWKPEWDEALRGQRVCASCWKYAHRHEGKIRIPRVLDHMVCSSCGKTRARYRKTVCVQCYRAGKR